MADSTAYAKYGGLVGASSGVTSLNGLTGAVTLAAGTGISITPSGNTLTLASTSAGDVTIGAFGSTPNANGLSINGSQVLNMQPADGTHPGGLSILAQTIAGIKTFSSQILASDGTVALPGLAFANNTDSGLYRIGAGEIAIAIVGAQAMDFKKSGGGFGNVGMGGAASASDNYPLLIQRSNVSTGTYAQISNPDTSASSKATWQLSADAGNNNAEVSLFTAATATDAYANAMTVRPSGNTAKLSLIGGDLSTGYVTHYVAGDYTSAGENTRFAADKSIQLMQQIATPATPASGSVKLYQKSDGRLYQKSAAGTERILGSSDAAGTVTSVALTVPASSLFSVSGSPVTSSGTLAVATAGTSGGVPYFDTTSTLNSSGLLATKGLVLGGGAGATPTTLATSASTTAALISGGTNTAPSWGTLAIGGGGTGQTTKAAAFDALQPMTTGGDLIYGGASGTGTRLANGSAGQFLKSQGTTLAPIWAPATVTYIAPTVQKFTSSSGTYTTAANVLYIKVQMVGGGGGGGGSGTSTSTHSGGDGGNSTFGTSLLVANGGKGGNGSTGAGGAGGTASLGSGPIGTALSGGSGTGLDGSNAVSANGGAGASSALGGGGGGATGGAAGLDAIANTGGGAGGGGGGATAFAGAGGGAGGWVDAIISSPSATYAYTIGAAGTAGTAGTSGFAGGTGGSGYIIVLEYYQ